MTTYDLLLKNARVIDPTQHIDQQMDLAIIQKKLIAIDSNLAGDAKSTVDCHGKIITPGLIDLHTHIYWGGASLCVDPKIVAAKSAATCLVDAGSAGAGNFLGFKAHVIQQSPIPILSFLNISYPGIFGFSRHIMVGEGSIPNLLSVDAACEVARNNPEWIRGIKARACKNAAGEYGDLLITKGIEAAEKLNLPLMTHIGVPPPSYSAVLAKLRPGDVVTHAFRPDPNSGLDKKNNILSELLEARDRGVLFDIGHGMGGFSFQVATKMLANGFYPDTISSDIHCLSINGPAYDLLTTMSKLYALGMPLKAVIAASSSTPATILKKTNWGAIRCNETANLSIFELQAGNFEFHDAAGQRLNAKERFVAHGAVRAGVYYEVA